MTALVRRRALPVAALGAVNVLAPKNGQRYYRLTWTNPDGTAGRTSGGTTLAPASAKATGLDALLRQAAGSRAMTPLREVLDDYLSTGKGRHQKIKGGDWKNLQLKQQRSTLNRCTRGHEDLLAMSVDRAALDRMRAVSGTPRTRKENATALRGLLRWGYAQGYFSAEQSELLPMNVPDLPGTVMGTPAPARRRRARAVGQHPDFIAPEDAPSNARSACCAASSPPPSPPAANSPWSSPPTPGLAGGSSSSSVARPARSGCSPARRARGDARPRPRRVW